MVTHAHNGYTCYHVQWTLDVHGEKFPTLDVRGKVYRLEGYIIHRLTKRHGVSSHAQFNDGCAIKHLVKTHKVVFVLHSYPHLLPTPLSLRQIPASTLLWNFLLPGAANICTSFGLHITYSHISLNPGSHFCVHFILPYVLKSEQLFCWFPITCFHCCHENARVSVCVCGWGG